MSATKLPAKSKLEIVEVYQNGLNGKPLSVKEIAQVFGTSSSVVSCLAKRAGLTRKKYACVVDCDDLTGSYGRRRVIGRVMSG